jgi:hypothetical protein
MQFVQWASNIPDNQTIVTTSGKLAVNKDDASLTYETADAQLRALGVVPIGCVVFVAGSITGCPAVAANFQLCNGAAISNARSLMNGQNTPNITGSNRFIRGNTTSGTTGGAATAAHTHTVAGSAKGNDNNDPTTIYPLSSSSIDTGSTSVDTVPPYLDLIPYIRIY